MKHAVVLALVASLAAALPQINQNSGTSKLTQGDKVPSESERDPSVPATQSGGGNVLNAENPDLKKPSSNSQGEGLALNDDELGNQTTIAIPICDLVSPDKREKCKEVVQECTAKKSNPEQTLNAEESEDKDKLDEDTTLETTPNPEKAKTTEEKPDLKKKEEKREEPVKTSSPSKSESLPKPDSANSSNSTDGGCVYTRGIEEGLWKGEESEAPEVHEPVQSNQDMTAGKAPEKALEEDPLDKSSKNVNKNEHDSQPEKPTTSTAGTQKAGLAGPGS